jgi:diphthine methyl ester synthase
MLYLVGLGLADERDITIRGLEVVKSAERVYLEAYTSILLVDKEKLVRRCSILTSFYLQLEFFW